MVDEENHIYLQSSRNVMVNPKNFVDRWEGASI